MRRRRGPFAAAAVIVLAVLADIGWIGWQRSQMAAAAPSSAVRELLVGSEDTGCFFDGAPSPDGTRILHTDWCTGDIYVRHLESGSMEFITEYEFTYGGAWLPDGKQISVGPRGPFESPTIIDLETGTRHVPEHLAGLALTPIDWSVDGDHLLGFLEEGGGGTSTVLMSVSTGDRTVVRAGGGSGARFSPDGRYVLFGHGTEPNRDLSVLDVQSGERWPLVESPGDEGDALWSPDGTTVAYQARAGGPPGPFQTRNGRPSGPPPAHHPADEVEPTRLERARLLLRRRLSSDYNLYRIEVDPRVRAEPRGDVTRWRCPTKTPARSPVLARWAPDMGRMAIMNRSEGKLVHREWRSDDYVQPFPTQTAPAALVVRRRPGGLHERTLAWGWGEPDRRFTPRTCETGAIREAVSGRHRGRARFHHVPRRRDGSIWVQRRSEDPLDRRASWELMISDIGRRRRGTRARRIRTTMARCLAQRASGRFSPDGSWIVYRPQYRPYDSEARA